MYPPIFHNWTVTLHDSHWAVRFVCRNWFAQFLPVIAERARIGQNTTDYTKLSFGKPYIIYRIRQYFRK